MMRLLRSPYRSRVGAALLALSVASCSGVSVPDAPPQRVVAPFLHRPFAGEYQVSNVFDHDLPVSFADHNGAVVAWWGDTVSFLDGHQGYDWGMPEGTPLVAAAGGLVTRAGPSNPSYCPPLGRSTTNNVVTILHETPEGERYFVAYVHVFEVRVQVGDVVEPGQVVALSGNTGCSLGPHLHFQVEYEAHWAASTTAGALPVTAEVGVAVDPYGWAGSGADPWAQYPLGAVSQWLWVDGAAPAVGGPR